MAGRDLGRALAVHDRLPPGRRDSARSDVLVVKTPPARVALALRQLGHVQAAAGVPGRLWAAALWGGLGAAHLQVPEPQFPYDPGRLRLESMGICGSLPLTGSWQAQAESR